MARAASSSVVSRMVAKRCGSWLWSMTPTDQPSASSQMLRVCLAVDLHSARHIAFSGEVGSRCAAFSPLCPSLSPRAERDDREASRGRSHVHRLRSRIQQPRPRARTPGNLRTLDARGRGLSRRSHEGAARRARTELRIVAAPVHRPVFASPRCHVAARAVHPWRLLALARPIAVQPHGARAECARRGGRGRGLRSRSASDHRRDHRPDPARLPVHVAAHRPAHDGVRPLSRRTSRRRHGRDRVA